MSETEFETICMIIEHLEEAEDIAYKKSMYYFNNKIYDKSLIFEGLESRLTLEIQLLEDFIKSYDVRRESEE